MHGVYKGSRVAYLLMVVLQAVVNSAAEHACACGVDVSAAEFCVMEESDDGGFYTYADYRSCA